MTLTHRSPYCIWDLSTGFVIKSARVFRCESEIRRCLNLLYNTTTEHELLATANGNKWVVRYAIEIYKRNGMYGHELGRSVHYEESDHEEYSRALMALKGLK